MKQFYFVTIAFFFLSSANAQGFQKVYGTAGEEQARVVQQTSDGGYMIAGQAYYPGYGGYLLVKTDANGDTLWTRSYYYPGALANTLATAVQTSDGGYALAGSSHWGSGEDSIYFVKTDGSGNVSWTKEFDGFFVNDILQTSDGGYLLTGWDYYGNISLVKLDAAGTIQWAEQYVFYWHTVYDDLLKVREISGGYILAASLEDFSQQVNGLGIMQINSSGNVTWSNILIDTSVAPLLQDLSIASNGDLLLVGNQQYTGGFLVRISATGNLIWQKKYSSAGGLVETNDAAELSSGNIDLAGSYYGYTSYEEAMQLMLNSSGTVLSGENYAPSHPSSFSSMDMNSSGELVMAGLIDFVNDTGSSFFMAKTNSGGISGCNEIPQTVADSNASFTDTAINVTSNAYLVSEATGSAITYSGLSVFDGCVLGVEENTERNEASAFPNPFSSSVKIQLKDFTGRSELRLYDLQGDLVRQFTFEGNSVEMQRGDLAPGIYFYRIMNGRNIFTGRLIAE